MRVFLCEFVTGGGMRDNPLPGGLIREGGLMRDAMARDLAELPDVALITTHDDRVAPAPHGDSRPIAATDDPWEIWAERARDADVAWVVAPETGGLLLQLTNLCREAGADVVGPDAETIRIASRKSTTAAQLAPFGLTTVPTWGPNAVPPDAAGPFVTKPDDGAGCEATRFWRERPDASALGPSHIVQPYVAGEAASLTALRRDGATTLLAANRQDVVITDGVFAFNGMTVAALDDPGGRLAAVAEAVGRALPGLDGFFGVDMVLGGDGPVVIEVNPRITTSYSGLRAALGLNPALLIPQFRRLTEAARATPGASRPVEIRL